MRTSKLIGEAVRAPGPHTGWIVRLLRYPSGRKLPEPRYLVDVTRHQGEPYRFSDPKPFRSPLEALAALAAYRADPRSVLRFPALPHMEVKPTAPALRPTIPLYNPELDHVEERRKLKVRRRRPRKSKGLVKLLPAVEKIFPEPGPRGSLRPQPVRNTVSSLIDEIMSANRATVTRYLEAHRPMDLKVKRKSVGVMPVAVRLAAEEASLTDRDHAHLVR